MLELLQQLVCIGGEGVKQSRKKCCAVPSMETVHSSARNEWLTSGLICSSDVV